MLKRFLATFDIVGQCRRYHVTILSCPPVLFIVMGAVIIIGMLATTVLAQQFTDDPAVVVTAVSVMTTLLFIVGHAVVSSFERIADVSRMKSEFVSIVSHQLRSPLAAIKWQLELMLGNADKLPGTAAATLVTLKEQNERMILLVNDLLETSRIEDDRLVLRPTYMSLDEFVEKALALYKARMTEAHIELTLDTRDKPLEVYVDESKLRWILDNLLDNAIRYVNKERGEMKVRVVKDGRWARVEVEDNGIGIPIHDQRRIFSKFFRASNAFHLQTEGTGLGLFLVKSLTHVMGGKVGFASIEGKGSTFWFMLPLIHREK